MEEKEITPNRGKKKQTKTQRKDGRKKERDGVLTEHPSLQSQVRDSVSSAF